ncbi:nucleotidyltransferase domain-containing protein [Candidatus Woesearchaeota archaeon]|nr:nucleotidyltransferase domain-containing protein [Candidatus Woesearchaeota archaeon]
MVQYKSVLKDAMVKILPTVEERQKALSEVNVFLKELNSELKRVRVKAVAVLGGSYAKDTWLSGDYDVDVFVRFDLAHKAENLSDLLERALKKWHHERIHGSRDYFWVRNGIRYEIVPVLNIRRASDAENVTDFSPLHVAWVNKNGSKLKNDIRLVKKFCKASRCYGAESYIRGFSGHVVDVLVVYYGGFVPLLKAASKWVPKVVVDVNRVYKGKALLVLNKSKTEGPLVVVDPVQPARNAAAALTLVNFDCFVSAAEKFLKKPSCDFFVEHGVDAAVLAKKGYLVSVEVATLDAKEDVAGAKFVRAFEHMRDALSDFGVKDSVWVWDRKGEGKWFFVLKTKELSAVFDWPGPPVKLVDAVKKFKQVYKGTFVRAGRVWAKVKRDERKPEQVVRRVLQDEFVRSRIKSARLI